MPLEEELPELDLTTTVEIDAEQLAPIWREGIRAYTPDDETVRQLVAAQRDRRRAVDVRYFATLAEGRIAAYCELFTADGVGQVESVMCLQEFRGRGLGKAVTARAAAESVAAGHELTFLVADAADWPKHLYAGLGFREAARIWDFVRERA
jgi:predicted GNAT family acetyltransferase